MTLDSSPAAATCCGRARAAKLAGRGEQADEMIGGNVGAHGLPNQESGLVQARGWTFEALYLVRLGVMSGRTGI